MTQTKFKQTEIGLIPEDWEVKKLGEITKFQYGLGESAEESGEYTYIRITDITSDNTLNKSGLVYINRNKVKENCILNKGDVLIARTGATFGKTLLFNENFKATYCGFLIKFLFNENLINNHFFFQYTRSNNYWHQAHNLVNGGAQPQFNANTISELIIPIPPLQEQSAIAKILSDLDSKIELLQKQNETLEKIGQAIFKHWFVDFEFPNEEGKPYKSSGGKMVESELGEIPKGWSVGFLDDGLSTKLIKTGIDSFEGEKIYLDTASVQNADIVDLSTKITINEKPSRANMQPIHKSIWFAKMKDSKKVLLIDSRDDWLIKNIILSTGFSGLTTFNDLLYYIWTIINSDKFEIEKNSLCLGTTMQAINNENIRKIKYVIPSNNLIQSFNTATSKNYEKISSNKSEILSLQKTRDLLLPKLMTGKIRVPLEVEE